MTQPVSLPARVAVVNVGLPLFGDAIREQGAPVVSVDWRVPAGGQPAAVAALGRLYGIHAERIDAANAEVLRRLDRGIPLLTGITTVAGAVPGLPEATLLHCGPAIGYADAPDPLRRSMRAAAVAEGWAASPEQADGRLGRGEIGLSPANDHRVVVPMATAVGASAPLYVLSYPGRGDDGLRAGLAGAGRGGLVRVRQRGGRGPAGVPARRGRPGDRPDPGPDRPARRAGAGRAGPGHGRRRPCPHPGRDRTC